MSALRTSAGGLDGRRLDAIFAVLLIVELELEIWLTHQPAFILTQRPLQAVAAVFYVAPIAFRRRWPAGALVFCGVVALAQALAGGYLVDATIGTTVPPAVLGYAAGAWLDLRRGLLALVLGVSLFAGAALVSDVIAPPPQHAVFATDLVVDSLLIAGPWLVGRLARERNRRAAAFRELAAQATAEREERARAAIAEERIRIGRELQDIIAHSVSVMVIQAGGARRLLRSEPDRARDSILSVEQTGRGALADLRRLLGMLRKDDDPRALTPQPGLDQLTALLAQVREEGMECELSTAGEQIDLTPGIDLVGYRVIETALQLLVRHRSRLATVTVRYENEWLELEISGTKSIPDLEHELNAIGERVALYDGSLRSLPPRDGGFRVQARLPLGGGGCGMSMSILIADDQALVRAGFRMILESEDDLRVVAEAKDGAEAVEATRRVRPDLILMDIRMPTVDGLEATRQIMATTKRPPHVLMLTTFDLDEYVLDALRAGASGFMLKDVSPEELVAGVRVVARGDSLLAPKLTRRLIESFIREHPQTQTPPPELEELTPRELEVFTLLARGLSNAEIAQQLVVSGTTVRTHVARVLFKLGLRDRVQAVVLAYESGIVRPGTDH